MAVKTNSSKRNVANNSTILTNNSGFDIFHLVLISLLAIILFYPPYFRGLFFQTEQQWHVLYAGILAVIVYVWRVKQGKPSILSKPMDYLVLGLIVCYTISFFGAAAPRLALAEIVKYTIYFLVFWMTSRIVRNESDVNIILHAFFLSAVGVALAGVMTATEIIHINDGFVYGRIFSTMQYPNSLASYLGGLSFLGIYLWSKQDNYLKYLYTAGTYTILSVFIATSSRGAMIFFPLTFIVYLLFVNKGKKLSVSVHTIGIVIGGIVANYRLIADALAKNYTGTWMWFFVGLAVALLLDFGIDYSVRNFRQYAKQGLIVVLVLALAFLGLGIYKATTSKQMTKLMPENLVKAIQNIKWQDRDVQERLVFEKDALKIVKDHPVFGFGGGVFEETFRYYQSYFYSSTQVHSHDFQLWAESGTVGFLVWLSIFLLFFWTFFKLWRKAEGNKRLLLISMFATGLMLWLHAWMDFDFSLSSIPIVYFGMIGLTRGLERINYNEDKVWNPKDIKMWGWWMVGGVAAVIALFLVIDVRFITGESYAKQAYDTYQSGNQSGAIPFYQKAVDADPWKTDYLTDLAKMQMNNGQQDAAVQNMQKALLMNKYNAQIYSDAANMFWSTGKYDDAVQAMETARKLFRFNYNVYEAAARIHVMGGLVKMQQNDFKTAQIYFERAAETPDLIAKAMQGMPEKYIKMWGTQALPVLTYTPQDKLNVGIAWHFLGDDTKAEGLLQNAYQDGNAKGEAAFWLAVLSYRGGNKAESDKYLAEAQRLVPQFAKDFRNLAAMPPVK